MLIDDRAVIESKEQIMFSITRIVTGVALAALVVGVGVGIAGPPSQGETPVTLTLAGMDGPGRPASRIADRFAAKVNTLSKGAIKVKVAYSSGFTMDSTPTRTAYRNVFRSVKGGEVQLALLPSSTFEDQGVLSFRAIQAPFLLTTDKQLATATAGALAAKQQSGLSRVGLDGLALIPDGFRRPFGFVKTLASLSDFKGTTVRVNYSRPTFDLIRALGGKPLDLNGAAYGTAVESGRVKAAETSFGNAPSGLPRIGHAVGNLAFYPRADALVVNSAALAELSSANRAILRQAAAETRTATIASENEAKAASAYCRAGGTIVNVSPEVIAQLKAKAAPVTAALQTDPTTRQLISSFKKLPVGPGAVIAPCGTPPTAEPPFTVKGAPPNGTYRRTITKAEFIAQGVDVGYAEGNFGTMEWTMNDGSFTFGWTTPTDRQRPGTDSGDPACTGKFDLSHGALQIRWTNDSCQGPISLVWKQRSGSSRDHRRRCRLRRQGGALRDVGQGRLSYQRRRHT